MFTVDYLQVNKSLKRLNSTAQNYPLLMLCVNIFIYLQNWGHTVQHTLFYNLLLKGKLSVHVFSK